MIDASALLQADQDASGVGVLPERTSKLTAVPPGSTTLAVKSSQSAVLPASSTRDSKAHGELYGVSRIQSTVTAVPPVLKSLAPRTIDAVTVTVSVWRKTPSIKNRICPKSHSIRYMCGLPNQLVPSGTSTIPTLLDTHVRAYT